MDYTELRKQLNASPIPGRKRAILLSTGSFCPVHFGHLQNLDIAAKFLSNEYKIDTLVAYISPSCDSYVSQKLGDEFIPFVHRYEMIKIACQIHNNDSNVIPIIPSDWEGKQKCFIPFPDVFKHFQKEIKKKFPSENLIVLYVAGADHFNRRQLYRKSGYVGISRVGYEIQGQTNKQKDVYICKDKRYERFFNDISSTAIRNARAIGKPIYEYTYYPVVMYLHNVLHWI